MEFKLNIITNKSSDVGYLPTLDGWRGIAILLVMGHHASDAIYNMFGSASSGLVNFFVLYGQMGVHIFFGISGFLICSRLLAEKAKFGQINLTSFYLRRAFRIMPAMLVFLVVTRYLSFNGVINVSLDSWLSALFFYTNYSSHGNYYTGHFWSLSVEEHFYLLWPAILVFSGKQKSVYIAISLAVFIGVWRALDLLYGFTVSEGWPNLWGRSDTQMDGLLWGCVVAVLYNEDKYRSRLLRFLFGYKFNALLMFVFFMVWRGPWYKVWLVKLMAWKIIIPFIIVGTVMYPKSWLGLILELTVLKYIGRISYSLYLWQELFLVSNSSLSLPMGVLQTLPVSLACVFICALISFYAVEKPCIYLGRRAVNYVLLKKNRN